MTQEQSRNVATSVVDLPEMIDPTTQHVYVLVPKNEYERFKNMNYDDSPWTDPEMDALALEVDAMHSDDMTIEDEES